MSNGIFYLSIQLFEIFSVAIVGFGCGSKISRRISNWRASESIDSLFLTGFQFTNQLKEDGRGFRPGDEERRL